FRIFDYKVGISRGAKFELCTCPFLPFCRPPNVDLRKCQISEGGPRILTKNAVAFLYKEEKSQTRELFKQYCGAFPQQKRHRSAKSAII
ncbi:MAG: hypothetical protein ACI3WQ_03700, partial [Faecousia sp.]